MSKKRKKSKHIQSPIEPDEKESLAEEMTGALEEEPDSDKETGLMWLGEPGALEWISPLQRYLEAVKQHPLLSRDEEIELATRFKEKGDRDAAERLVLGNLRLVVKIALEYQRHWQDLLDLVQEGNMGLVLAVKKFDPYRGVRFSTYASFWIRAYILKFLMENFRLVKIGTTQAQRRLFFNLKKERDRLEAFGFKPAPALLARSLDVKESEIRDMEQRLGASEESLEKPVTEDREQTLEAVLADETPGVDTILAEDEFDNLVREKLLEFRAQLKEQGMEKDVYIFDNRLLSEEPLTLKELGEHFNISRERVRQIETRLLKKLREFLEQELPEFDASDFLAGE
jgi:RNA polymerase sigma-32 factor